MEKIVNLICEKVEKNLIQGARPKTNEKLYNEYSLLAHFAYNNMTEKNCSTWLLNELLKSNLHPSAYKGFWQTFDTLVSDTFNSFISDVIKQVLKAPRKNGFALTDMYRHFLEQQFKENHPRTLPEEIRWFLAGAVQKYICDSFVEDELQVLHEICSGDFGQPYIEHLIIKNAEVDDFINKVAQSLLK